MEDTQAAWEMIGGCVRLARKARGVTLSELAEAVGYDVSTVSRFESGQRGLPVQALAKASALLRVDDTLTERVRQVMSGPPCTQCGDAMGRSNSRRRFCSTRCRVAAHRAGSPPVVYFLRRGDHVKIGTTVALRERVRSFQQNLADVLATLPGDYSLEAEWHARFAHLRDDNAYGGREWFRFTPELESAIASAGGGQ